MTNESQDTFNQSVSNAQWEAYGKALAHGMSAEDAIKISKATAQAMRDERTLMNAAERIDSLRPHKAGIARSILSVLRRGKDAAIVALAVAAILASNLPAHAAPLADPKGYRRCLLSEIRADPTHKVCRLATWVEGRNSGFTVTFRAYVRKLRAGERQR